MYKSTTKCNETLGKWCKNKHGASKIIDTFETYQALNMILDVKLSLPQPLLSTPCGGAALHLGAPDSASPVLLPWVLLLPPPPEHWRLSSAETSSRQQNASLTALEAALQVVRRPGCTAIGGGRWWGDGAGGGSDLGPNGPGRAASCISLIYLDVFHFFGTLGFVPRHEVTRSTCSRHVGGDLFIRRSWSAHLQRLGKAWLP
jgi:hypothetical protein